MSDPTGMSEARDLLEHSIKSELARYLEDTVDQIDGPVREAANRLVVAARRGRRDLADECRDQLELEITERQMAARDGMADMLDAFLTRGIGLLFDGLSAGLRVVGARR